MQIEVPHLVWQRTQRGSQMNISATFVEAVLILQVADETVASMSAGDMARHCRISFSSPLASL